MIDENDIVILYYRLLHRTSTSNDLDNVSQFEDIHQIEEYIYNTIEYKKINDQYYGDMNYDNNILKLTNIYHDKLTYKGVILGNNVLSFETSQYYNVMNKHFIYNGFESCDVLDMSNIIFNSSNIVSNHTQQLDTNLCVFTDEFYVDNDVTVTIEKRCLQTYKNMFLQSITLNSTSNKTFNISHIFKYDINIHKFKTYILSNNDTSYHFSHITDDITCCTNIYICNSQLIHKGYKPYNNNIHYNLEIDLVSDTDVTLYILSSFNIVSNNFNLNITNKLLMDNDIIDIISNHTNEWQKKWNTNFEITPKNNISDSDLLTIKHVEYITRISLYNIFVNSYDDDIFTIPILILLNQPLAIQVIERNCDTFDKMIYNTQIYGKEYQKFILIDDLSNFNLETKLYKHALLVINIWNLFRVSRNINWLHNYGYPYMIKIVNYLMLQFDFTKPNVSLLKMKTKENVFITYLIMLAFKYTLYAIYQLNLIIIDDIIHSYNSLQINLHISKNESIITNTNIHIRVEYIDGLWCYVFFSSSNEKLDSLSNNLGYKFGGSSGYTMNLIQNTIYTFYIDKSLARFPIVFVNTSGDKIEFVKNKLEINSNSLRSYIYKYQKSARGILQNKFNYNYGSYAFNSDLELQNILKIYDDYENNQIHIVEPFIILTTYFNDLLFSDMLKDQDKLDIIKDNIAFFKSNANYNKFNKLILSYLYANIAQYEHVYELKRNDITMFYDLFSQYNDTIESPWYCEYSSMRLFVFFSGLGGLYINGNMNSKRYQQTQYDIYNSSKNVLPITWKKLVINNIKNKQYVYNNLLFNDEPFNFLPDNIRFDVTYNEMNKYVQVKFDIYDIIKSAGYTYKYYLQDVSDTTQHTFDQVQENQEASSDNIFRIDYLEPESPNSDIVNIPELKRRIFNIILWKDDNQYIINHTINDVINPFDSLINPTIHCNIRYLTTSNHIHTKVILDLYFNSQNQNIYDCIKEITLKLTFDNALVSTPTFSNVTTSDDICIDYVTIGNTVDIKFDLHQISFHNIQLGTLEFDMISFNRENHIPFSGNITSINIAGETEIKPLHIDNITEYPPQNMNNVSHVIGHNIIHKHIDANNIDKQFYNPTNIIYSSGNNNFEQIGQLNEINLRPFDASTQINNFLTDNSFHIVEIIPAVYHTFFIVNKNIYPYDHPKYYGIGNNSFNKLLIDDSNIDDSDIYSENNEINEISFCGTLEDFINDGHGQIKKLVTTNMSTIIITEKDEVYAIGDNENYNLCTGNNIDCTVLSECTLITELLTNTQSNIIHIICNDKCTLLYLSNNKLYVIGSNPIFAYVTVSELPNVERLEEAVQISTFLQNNDYVIERIEGGSFNFKFLLRNVKTDENEWWAIGQNRLNSLGVNYLIEHDDPVKQLTRMHQLEELIHGRKYNESYTGKHIIDNKQYVLLSNFGIPTFHIIVYDIMANTFYILGTVHLGTDIPISYVHYKWTECTYMNFNNNIPKYLISSNYGVFIGYNEDTIMNLKNNTYNNMDLVFLSIKLESSSDVKACVVNNYVYYNSEIAETYIYINTIISNTSEYFFEFTTTSSCELVFGNVCFTIENNVPKYFKLNMNTNTLKAYNDNTFIDLFSTIDLSISHDNTDNNLILRMNSYGQSILGNLQKKIILE
jgi:hypothetical protein